MTTPSGLLLLLVAVWLVTMTFMGGLAHRLSGAV